MDHFIKEVVNASLPGALKWDICWLSGRRSLAQLQVEEFGSICVLREELSSTGRSRGNIWEASALCRIAGWISCCVCVLGVHKNPQRWKIPAVF